jgi:hypothetical protein
MSQENVEIARQAIAAYGRGEVREDLIDPDIEIWESPELPGELAGRGYAALRRARETISDSFEDWSVEPERFVDLGERILVVVTVRATGRGSGLSASTELTYLMTVRDRRVIEWGLFGDRAEAYQAAGLRE